MKLCKVHSLDYETDKWFPHRKLATPFDESYSNNAKYGFVSDGHGHSFVASTRTVTRTSYRVYSVNVPITPLLRRGSWNCGCQWRIFFILTALDSTWIPANGDHAQWLSSSASIFWIFEGGILQFAHFVFLSLCSSLLHDSAIRWIWRFTPTVNWSHVCYSKVYTTYLNGYDMLFGVHHCPCINRSENWFSKFSELASTEACE